MHGLQPMARFYDKLTREGGLLGHLTYIVSVRHVDSIVALRMNSSRGAPCCCNFPLEKLVLGSFVMCEIGEALDDCGPPWLLTLPTVVETRTMGRLLSPCRVGWSDRYALLNQPDCAF